MSRCTVQCRFLEQKNSSAPVIFSAIFWIDEITFSCAFKYTLPGWNIKNLIEFTLVQSQGLIHTLCVVLLISWESNEAIGLLVTTNTSANFLERMIYFRPYSYTKAQFGVENFSSITTIFRCCTSVTFVGVCAIGGIWCEECTNVERVNLLLELNYLGKCRRMYKKNPSPLLLVRTLNFGSHKGHSHNMDYLKGMETAMARPLRRSIP